MNFPFSNSCQLYSNPLQPYENIIIDSNRREIQPPVYSYFEPSHNIRYFQIIPMVPSFYSFPNYQTILNSFNAQHEEKKNADSRKNLTQEVQNNPFQNQTITQNNLNFVEILDKKKEMEEIPGNEQGNQSPLLKKKIYKQNPNRNIITNIGNQLITFVSNKRKSRAIIQKLKPNWSQKNIDEYYDYARTIKSSTDYYLNSSKMKKIWYPKETSTQKQEFQQIIRILSLHFLNELFCPAILTSRKMKKQSKILHLNSRNQLLNKLKYNDNI